MRTFKPLHISSLVAILAVGLSASEVSAANGTIHYSGGPVATQPKIIMVYVGGWDNSAKSLNAQAAIERFMTNIGATKYYVTLSGYYDSTGKHIVNSTFPIIQRLYDPDTTNPMSAAKVNPFVIPYLTGADLNTLVIQVPYAGIGTSCSGGTQPMDACNGNFGAPSNAPTAIIPAFDGSGNFQPSFGGVWSHEIGEAMTDSNGEGWWVGGDYSGQLGDVCDYSDSPWLPDEVQIPARFTWQNDAFTVRSFPVYQLNPGTAPIRCSHSYSENADLFGVGYDPYHLYHEHLSATSSISHTPWNDLGTLNSSGFLAGGPGVASWGIGRTDVFNFDWSHTLRHGYFDSSIPSCASPNGTPCLDNWGGAPAGWSFDAEPAVTSYGEGRLDLFVVGTSGSATALFQRTWDSGSDTGWVSRGTPGVALVGGAAAAAASPGRVDAFAIGADNNVYMGSLIGSTFSWKQWIGGQSYNGSPIVWQGHPSATSWEPGAFHVMLIDTAGRLWDCGGSNYTAAGSCNRWSPPSGVTFTNSPTITNLGDLRLVISARGTDGQDWMTEWNNGFTAWIPSAGGLAGASPSVSY